MTTRLGRKAAGTALVQGMNGSQRAKQRLEVILESIAGRLTTPQACAMLGLSEAMFYRLRSEVLRAALSELEPQPQGRPPRRVSDEERQLATLAQRVAELEAQLQLAAVREELTHVLPRLVRPSQEQKKTTQPRAARPTKLNRQPSRRAARRNRPR